MFPAKLLIEALFWLCAGLTVYAYIGYPLLIWCISRAGRNARPAAPSTNRADSELPSVSLLISAYNEEAVIGARIENALALDYPRNKLEVIIASDGSSDRTAEIVRGYGDRGITFLDFPHNGKATVLNSSFPLVKGDIVFLSDANTEMDADALRRVTPWFTNPDVGVVCGKLILTDPQGGTNCDGAYWHYENFLKQCEGRLGALLGANGGIYAIRKELFRPIPTNTTVDDFVIPMAARQRTGCLIVYERDAIAREETHPEMASEFQRRCRFGASGFQNITIFWRLLNPARGWIALTFFSHKVLRWTCPFFLIGAILSNAALAILDPRPVYRATLLVQILFYGLAALMPLIPARVKGLKPLRLTSMFTNMNLALFVGFCRWLRGSQGGTWKSSRAFGS